MDQTPSSSTPSTNPVVLTSLEELRKRRLDATARDRRIGFVPTMGALHEGHLDLVRAAARSSDEVYVSIFVNPTQFGPTEDLARYPRSLAMDLEALGGLDAALARDSPITHPGRVTTIWTPSVEDVYPFGPASLAAKTIVDPALGGVLEGASRLGFFDGVATVVLRLLNAVQPHVLCLGQKDFQQCVVLRRVLRDWLVDTAVEIVPTAREGDGLALSSRNRYLGERRRKVAPVLMRALEVGVRSARKGGGNGVREVARAMLEAKRKEQEALPPGERARFSIDYLELVSRDTLQRIERVALGEQAAALTGAIVMLPLEEPGPEEIDPALSNPVRLIDNMFVS